jgi:accessory gene regulator B
MKEKFVNSSIKFIMKYQECDDLKLKKLNYGLQGIYSLIVKLSVIIIIAIITKTIKQTIWFLFFYTGIRTYSFGWHAKTNIGCWISSIIAYNIIPLLIKNYIIPDIIGYIILGIALISMILWSPADTQKRPLIRKEHRKKCKIISTAVIIIYIVLFVLKINHLINNAIIYASFIQSLFINPLFYKITKTQFNNYKYYRKTINMV